MREDAWVRERGCVGVRGRMRGCAREDAWVRERGYYRDALPPPTGYERIRGCAREDTWVCEGGCVGAQGRIRGSGGGDAQVVENKE